MEEPDEDFARQLAAYVRQLAMEGTLPTGSLEVTAKPAPGYRGHLHGIELLVPDPHVPGLIRKGHIAAVHEEWLAGSEATPTVADKERTPGRRPSDVRSDTGPGAAWLALISEELPADEYVARRSAVMTALSMAEGPRGYVLRAEKLNDLGLAERQRFRMELAELAVRAFPTDRDAYERFTRALGIDEVPGPTTAETSSPIAGVLDYSDIAEALTRVCYQGKPWSYRAVYGRINSPRPSGVFREFLATRLPGRKFDRAKALALFTRIEQQAKTEAEEAVARLKAEQARKVAEANFAKTNSPLNHPTE